MLPSSRLLLLVLSVFIQRSRTEIAASSDLNCDFSSACRWRNGTNGMEDGADFVAGQNLQMDEFHKITALRPDQDDFFVYTYALGGRQEAMLISDVINCQLGGATVKFWYWRTGRDVNLDVCIRSPPGNIDRATMKCYDGLSATYAQQWLYRGIELPPVSQPFELVFRAIFTAPLDILAIDNISFDAILCDGLDYQRRPVRSTYRNPNYYRNPSLHSHPNRRKRNSMQVMSMNEWKSMMAENVMVESPHSPVMLIVADHIQEEPPESTSTQESPQTTTEAQKTTQVVTSSMTVVTTESPFPTLLKEEVTTSYSKDEPPSSTPIIPWRTNKDDLYMDNTLKFLKQLQPVLPYIPTLVRSLQSIDPKIAAATGTDPLVELNELSKIVGIDLVETAGELRKATAHAAPTQQQENFIPLPPVDHRYDGVLRPDKAPGNIFGLERASRAPSFLPSTVYPPRLVKSLKTTVHREMPMQSQQMVEETMDLSHLSTEEIKQLENFHKKIFHKRGETTTTTQLPIAEDSAPSPPLVVFNKKQKATPVPEVQVPIHVPNPGSGSLSDLLMDHMDDLKSILPADALEDLSKLREIPDLDELTRGMDVSLINKPGGFATLKKQFMQRMIRRSLGLPPEDVEKISNGGSSEGAGGHFDSPSTNSIGTLGSYAHDTSSQHFSTSQQSIDSRSPALAPPAPPPPSTNIPHGAAPIIAKGERSFQPTATQERKGAQFDSLCPALDCNFDSNNLCQYVTSTADSDLIDSLPSTGKQREFRVSSGRVSNSLTGIPADLMRKGSFVYAANSEHTSDQFVLSSTSPVSIPSSARLDFFVYLAGIHGRLKVCIDTLTNCPFEMSGRDIDLNSRQWRNFHVTLPEGVHAIHFVADRLKKNYAIGLDSIQLLNRYGMAALGCK